MYGKIIGGLLGTAALLGVSTVNAATISVNPSAILTAPGDTFTATVVGDFTDTGGVTDGGFKLTWDPTLLTLVSSGQSQYITDAYNSVGAITLFPPTYTSSSVDYIFSSCALGGACAVLGADTAFNMFDLTFQVAADAPTGVTTADLTFAFLAPDFFNCPTAQTCTQLPSPTFTGASISINAVPIPAAVWLFGSSLLGLVGVARRRSTTPTPAMD